VNLFSFLFSRHSRVGECAPPADRPVGCGVRVVAGDVLAPATTTRLPVLPEGFVEPDGLQRVFAVRVVQGEEAAYPLLVRACGGDVRRASDCIRWAVRVVAADRLAARAFGTTTNQGVQP
jgi:hypothetical protein